METVRTLVKTGHADVNHETCAGKTPLIEAARHGRTAVVRLLMELRAVIPYKNRRGQTAAWWAKRLGHQDCVLPMMREVKAEATLRLMSSQIGVWVFLNEYWRTWLFEFVFSTWPLALLPGRSDIGWVSPWGRVFFDVFL